MDGLLSLRSHPACCLLGRFFPKCFFPARFFSLTFSCELFSWELFPWEPFTFELFTCELSSLTRLLSSPWSLYLRIVLDRRHGCKDIACTGLLLRLLTVFLVLYCSPLAVLLLLSHRSFTVTCIFCAASITTKWKRQSLNRCVMKSAGIRHESSPSRYHAERCPTGDP